MNKEEVVSVPFIAYEKEMEQKNILIKVFGIIIAALVIGMVLIVFMFMSFINKHDYTSYDQDGNGINNINTGNQGDIINESEIEKND